MSTGAAAEELHHDPSSPQQSQCDESDLEGDVVAAGASQSETGPQYEELSATTPQGARVAAGLPKECLSDRGDPVRGPGGEAQLKRRIPKKPHGPSRKSRAWQEAEERSSRKFRAWTEEEGRLHNLNVGEYYMHSETAHLEMELQSVERRAESLRRSVKESRQPTPRQESKQKATVSMYLSRANESETKLRMAELEIESLKKRLSGIEEVHQKALDDWTTAVTAEHEAEVNALREKYEFAEAERIRFSEKVDDLEPALRKSNAVAEMLAKQLALGGDAEELRERLMRLEGQKEDALVDRTLSISEITENFGIDVKCPCVLSRTVDLEDIITHLEPNRISELGPYDETAKGRIRTVWGPEAQPFLGAWKKHERSWCSLECSPDYRAVRLLVPAGVEKLPENPVTYINREAVPAGSSKALTHGDVISFSCSPTEFSLIVPFHADANPNFHQIWDGYGCERTPVVSKTAMLEDVGFDEAWDTLPHAEIELSESERERHYMACKSHFKQMLATDGEEATREAIEQWKTAACFWRLYFLSGPNNSNE